MKKFLRIRYCGQQANLTIYLIFHTNLKKYIQKNLPGDLREEINEDLEDATDLNLDSLLGTLKGSVMIALNDLRPNPLLDIPSPDFFVGFSVKDSPQLDQLLARSRRQLDLLAASPSLCFDRRGQSQIQDARDGQDGKRFTLHQYYLKR